MVSAIVASVMRFIVAIVEAVYNRLTYSATFAYRYNVDLMLFFKFWIKWIKMTLMPLMKLIFTLAQMPLEPFSS